MPEARLFVVCMLSFYFGNRLQNIQSYIAAMIRYSLVIRDHVVEDESMLRTTESISMFGVLTPLIARPTEDGKFEIISGHRRAHAAEAVGLTEVPVIVRDMDDDAATVLMVDSNLQRESILPSERAKAYQMKMEALKMMMIILLVKMKVVKNLITNQV